VLGIVVFLELCLDHGWIDGYSYVLGPIFDLLGFCGVGEIDRLYVNGNHQYFYFM
jgi:hypothetical protein